LALDLFPRVAVLKRQTFLDFEQPSILFQSSLQQEARSLVEVVAWHSANAQ
jgi:hypothetical protein